MVKVCRLRGLLLEYKCIHRCVFVVLRKGGVKHWVVFVAVSPVRAAPRSESWLPHQLGQWSVVAS